MSGEYCGTSSTVRHPHWGKSHQAPWRWELKHCRTIIPLVFDDSRPTCARCCMYSSCVCWPRLANWKWIEQASGSNGHSLKTFTGCRQSASLISRQLHTYDCPTTPKSKKKSKKQGDLEQVIFGLSLQPQRQGPSTVRRTGTENGWEFAGCGGEEHHKQKKENKAVSLNSSTSGWKRCMFSLVEEQSKNKSHFAAGRIKIMFPSRHPKWNTMPK